MKLINKIKEYGIRNSLKLFYKYKLEPFTASIFKKIFSGLRIQNVIIFASHNDFDMNSGALYEYILSHDKERKYRLIWFVEHIQHIELPEGVFQVPINGINIRRYYWNSIAKYIFYDDTDVHKWKSGQTSTYLGHATRAMKNCRGKVPVPKDVDFVCSSSEDNDELMADVYSCEMNKMFHTGFPVTDVLFKQWDETKKLNIKTNYERIIIWMPTFRKSGYNTARNDSDKITETGLCLCETRKDIIELNDYLAKRNMLLIIKFHPAQDMSVINIPKCNNIIELSPGEVKRYRIDTYKLLTETSGLISDYSSISFDYLLLDKPIAYVLSDYESYKLGFAVENPKDFMPGEYLYIKEDFYRFIDSVAYGSDEESERRNKVRNIVAKYNDGKVAEKIVEQLSIL